MAPCRTPRARPRAARGVAERGRFRAADVADLRYWLMTLREQVTAAVLRQRLSRTPLHWTETC